MRILFFSPTAATVSRLSVNFPLDFCPYTIYYLSTGKSEVMNVSPRTGRPTTNKKTERLEIRLAPDEAQLLTECAERLQISKTAVINKGVRMVKAELDK